MVLMGLVVLPVYRYRKLGGTAVSKGPSFALLAGIWLAALWLYDASGATGQPFWLHAGVVIAFGVLTHADGPQEEGPEQAREASSIPDGPEPEP